MNMELSKPISLQAANFAAPQKQDSISVRIILNLLKDSIKNQKVITIEEIRGAHADYSMERRMHRAGWMYKRNELGESVPIRATTKEEWIECWSDKYKSLLWFKTNLGAAILKGRLLAIPIIEINENE